MSGILKPIMRTSDLSSAHSELRLTSSTPPKKRNKCLNKCSTFSLKSVLNCLKSLSIYGEGFRVRFLKLISVPLSLRLSVLRFLPAFLRRGNPPVSATTTPTLAAVTLTCREKSSVGGSFSRRFVRSFAAAASPPRRKRPSILAVLFPPHCAGRDLKCIYQPMGVKASTTGRNTASYRASRSLRLLVICTM